MKTTSNNNTNDPAWLTGQTTPPESRRSSTASYADDDVDRVGSGGRRYTNSKVRLNTKGKYYSYISDGEDGEDGDEDCCCCPMDPVLLGITIFHAISGLLGLAGIAVNIFHLIQPEESGLYQDIVQHSYCCVFCMIIMICEIDWRFLMKRFRILDLWIFRGFFYIYVGCQTADRIDVYELNDLITVCNLVAFGLALSGIMYTIMGICCIKSIAESKRRRQRYKEIDADSTVESV
jgi:hypothetical protein